MLRRATLLVFGLSSAAFAQVPAGPPVTITTWSFDQPAVAADPNTGRYFVVWNRGAAVPNVTAQRFERDGTALGAEFEVNSYAGFESDVTAAANADGTVFIAWQQVDALQIFGRAYDRDGNARGPEFRIDTAATGTKAFPVVASVAGGGFVAVWQHASDVSVIAGRRFDSGGRPLGAEFEVASQSTTWLAYPTVAGGADGSFLVVWQTFDGLVARSYTADGQPGPPHVVVTTAGDFPAVAPVDDRGYVVVWQQGPERNARFLDAGGRPLGAAFPSVQPMGSVEAQQVVADETGAFTITSTLGLDNPKDSVQAQRYTFAGIPREPQLAIDSSQHHIYYKHALASDAAGNLWVSWVNDLQGIRLQRYGGLLASGAAVDTFAWPLSDGNGVLEPGEAVDLRSSWRNVNGATQTFSGTLTNAKGPSGASYLITDPSGDYGTLADGSVAECTDCFGIAVSAPAVRPALHWDATADEYIAPDTLGQHKRWRLHVGDSFADVPRTSPYYRFVETVLHTGVTAGCGGGSFCPQSATSREQMAAQLLVSKEGSTYKAPPCGTPVFADVPPSSPFCPFIEELARRGITGGCGGGNFCPGAPVSREQMSVFVLRTLDPTLDPPACSTPVFADVPASSPFCRWIEELARRGIATGCGGGNFCPSAPVTREQMAVFLTQTFELRLY